MLLGKCCLQVHFIQMIIQLRSTYVKTCDEELKQYGRKAFAVLKLQSIILLIM